MVHINEASLFCFASTYYWRPRNKGQKETRGPCHPPVCCHGDWLKQKWGSAVEETLKEETAAVKRPALPFLVFVCPCLPSQTCLSRAPLWEVGVEVLWQLYGVPVAVYEMICRSCGGEVTFTHCSSSITNQPVRCQQAPSPTSHITTQSTLLLYK